jgi:TetR/AcrR family transcriptional repressor of lmrAB and yxaGH operons
VNQAPEAVPTRERILRAAIRLFQQRGYHGTGLSEILADADAPKGSLYHHFPEGKAQLGVAAIESVAADYEALFMRRRARSVSAANILRGLASAQAQWLKDTDWREGGLFSVLAQGFLPDAPEVHRALGRVYQRRRELLERALYEDGASDVPGIAALALAALDGGMIQAAAVRDAKPLLMAADRAARCIEAAI